MIRTCIVHQFSPQLDVLLTAYAHVFTRAFPGHPFEDSLAQARHEIARGDRFIFALDEDGNVLGFVTWERHGSPSNRLAELEHIGVDLTNPAARGIGRDLIAALEADVHEIYRLHRFPGARKIFLLTHAENNRAQNLYRKCGFVHTATLPEFWHPRSDHRSGDEYYFEKSYPD